MNSWPDPAWPRLGGSGWGFLEISLDIIKQSKQLSQWQQNISTAISERKLNIILLFPLFQWKGLRRANLAFLPITLLFCQYDIIRDTGPFPGMKALTGLLTLVPYHKTSNPIISTIIVATFHHTYVSFIIETQHPISTYRNCRIKCKCHFFVRILTFSLLHI